MASGRKQKNFTLSPELASGLKFAATELTEALHGEKLTETAIVSALLAWFIGLGPADQIEVLNACRLARFHAGGQSKDARGAAERVLGRVRQQTRKAKPSDG